MQQNSFHVKLSGLPERAIGTKIVQLTDIHRCKHTSDHVIKEAVRIALSLQPDVIVLTGDFVTEEPKDIAFCAELLAPLKAKYGVFAILGNHDYTTDAHEVIRSLSAKDIQFLINANITLPNDLTIAGIDDDREGVIDLESAYRGTPPETPLVSLIHNPSVVELISKRSGLALAGHTHGGQVDIRPFSDWEIRRIGGKNYKAGWFEIGEQRMYVNRGVGQVAFPFRFKAPPEVALFTLVATER